MLAGSRPKAKDIASNVLWSGLCRLILYRVLSGRSSCAVWSPDPLEISSNMERTSAIWIHIGDRSSLRSALMESFHHRSLLGAGSGADTVKRLNANGAELGPIPYKERLEQPVRSSIQPRRRALQPSSRAPRRLPARLGSRRLALRY